MCCKNRSRVGATHIQSTRTAATNPTYLPTLENWKETKSRVSKYVTAWFAHFAQRSALEALAGVTPVARAGGAGTDDTLDRRSRHAIPVGF